MLSISYILILSFLLSCYLSPTSTLAYQSLSYIIISLILFLISYLLSHSRFWSCKQIVLSSLLFPLPPKNNPHSFAKRTRENHSRCSRLLSPSLPVSLPLSPPMISLSQSAYTQAPQRSTSLSPTSTGQCRL